MKSILSGTPSDLADTSEIACDRFMARYVCARLLAAGLAVLLMVLLKHHYSLATATQLDWILAPTATLVAWSTSAHLVHESGVGYVDFDKGVIVAPACAGINFMIIAFGLTAFCGLHQIRRLSCQLAWLALALAAAYGLTLVVNSMRIALSMTLHEANIYDDWVTVARVHRLAGVGLYLGALWLYSLGLRQVIGLYSRHFDCLRQHRSRYASGWSVLGLYLPAAVGVPVANLAWRRAPPDFGEHCVTVIVASLAFWAVVTVTTLVLKMFYRCLSEKSA